MAVKSFYSTRSEIGYRLQPSPGQLTRPGAGERPAKAKQVSRPAAAAGLSPLSDGNERTALDKPAEQLADVRRAQVHDAGIADRGVRCAQLRHGEHFGQQLEEHPGVADFATHALDRL